MRLDYDFVVPRPVEAAWAVLTDLERLAPCLPGAQLTGAEGDDYHGTVRVKVGPVVAQYAGVAKFKELDPAAHHAVLEAKGKERSGRGLASALVTADLAPDGGQTRVRVGTDLTISGPLAQFGRGAITEISEKLFTQFIDRLKESLDAEPADGKQSADGTQPTGEAPVDGATASASTAAAPTTAAALSTPPPASSAPAVAPADMLRIAGMPILKRVVPLVVVVAVVVVVLVLWLG